MCSHLSRPRFESRPDGPYSSNVGLLLIMSQNNLSKKLLPFFSKASVVFREARMCASLWVCERMLSVAVFGSATSQTQQQKHSYAGLHKNIYHADVTSVQKTKQ